MHLSHKTLYSLHTKLKRPFTESKADYLKNNHSLYNLNIPLSKSSRPDLFSGLFCGLFPALHTARCSVHNQVQVSDVNLQLLFWDLADTNSLAFHTVCGGSGNEQHRDDLTSLFLPGSISKLQQRTWQHWLKRLRIII